jgi:mono/diheme cytochrome c family protein
MRRHAPMVIFAVCLSALGMAAVAGCRSSGSSGGGPSSSGGMMSSGGSSRSPGGGMMGPGGSGASGYSSVGERIYLTGVGSDGQRIAHSAPRVSQGSLMMGGGGCGSCHAADGRGGTISMMTGTAIKAPDITYGALIKAGFTDATIRTAIHDGLDETGKPLNDAMPRWQMGDADLGATIAYLKQLGAR